MLIVGLANAEIRAVLSAANLAGKTLVDLVGLPKDLHGQVAYTGMCW